MEAVSGTVLEVIAAEENLVQIEQKVLEIEYSYNLAKSKYLLDTAQLKY